MNVAQHLALEMMDSVEIFLLDFRNLCDKLSIKAVI